MSELGMFRFAINTKEGAPRPVLAPATLQKGRGWEFALSQAHSPHSSQQLPFITSHNYLALYTEPNRSFLSESYRASFKVIRWPGFAPNTLHPRSPWITLSETKAFSSTSVANAHARTQIESTDLRSRIRRSRNSPTTKQARYQNRLSNANPKAARAAIALVSPSTSTSTRTSTSIRSLSLLSSHTSPSPRKWRMKLYFDHLDVESWNGMRMTMNRLSLLGRGSLADCNRLGCCHVRFIGTGRDRSGFHGRNARRVRQGGRALLRLCRVWFKKESCLFQ